MKRASAAAPTTSDGDKRPVVIWKNRAGEVAARHVVARLNERAGRKEDGRVTFKFGIDEQVSLICSLVALPEDLTEVVTRRLVREGIWEAAEASLPLSTHSLSTAINGRKISYQRIRKKPRVLLTTISLVGDRRLAVRRTANAVLRVTKRRPAGFVAPDAVGRAAAGLYAPAPTDYSFIRVEVSARCTASAVEVAANEIDRRRALWNLYLQLGQGSRVSVGRTRPINEVVLGPIATLHYPSGKPVEDTCWWEPSYVEASRPKRLTDKLDGLRKFEGWAQGRSARSALHRRIDECLIRYVRAGDRRDMSEAFSDYWGVLERLTQSVNGDHRTVVRRTAAIFQSREYQLVSLDGLRLARNKLIHESSSPLGAEELAHRARYCAQQLIIFLLETATWFESGEELGQFLDLGALERKRRDRLSKLFERGARFHGRGE